KLASPKQTALGKDFSNLFMAGNLLKLYGFQLTMPHNKELASPKQMALAKPTESEGFEQIIDFLNGSSVRYALTASPTIRTSCIKQFWSMAKVKPVNDEVRVQALIDAKRVNIKESSICRTLKLNDDEGTSCLANDEIFTGLANMGYEKISDKLAFYKAFFSPQWNIMASAIIYLAINQKFNFLRYILLSLVKNIEAGVPFYMFLRVGTGFSKVITPSFKNMLVPTAEEVGQAQDDVSIPIELSTSKPYKKHKSKKQQPIAPKVPSPESSPEHIIPSPSNDPIPDADKDNKIEKLEDRVYKLEEENKILKEKSFKSAKIDTDAPDIDEEEPAKVKEVLEVVTATKLITEVVTTDAPTTIVAQVPKVSAPKRRRGVVIQDPEEIAASIIVHTEVQSKDKGKGIIIEEPKPLKGQRSERQNNAVTRYQALKRKPLTEAQARKNMMIYLKNMVGFKMKFFKGMAYIEIRPLFEKYYNSNQAFLERVEEEVIVQEKEIKEEGNKRQGESLEQEIVKKQRMDKEAEELKRHLQIVSNDDDDVYTEATPLASKV
nr:hypothetical protein [Tanacetum cinerariifolium]